VFSHQSLLPQAAEEHQMARQYVRAQLVVLVAVDRVAVAVQLSQAERET
jgi:hypothetical protein